MTARLRDAIEGSKALAGTTQKQKKSYLATQVWGVDREMQGSKTNGQLKDLVGKREGSQAQGSWIPSTRTPKLCRRRCEFPKIPSFKNLTPTDT